MRIEPEALDDRYGRDWPPPRRQPEFAVHPDRIPDDCPGPYRAGNDISARDLPEGAA